MRDNLRAQLGLAQRAIRRKIAPIDAIAKYVPVGANVLEIGCGEGLVLQTLLGRANRLVGTDIDDHKLALLRRTLPMGRVEVRREDILTTLATPLDVDIVILADVLSSFSPDNQRHILEQLTHVLPSGGTLVLKAIDAAPRWKSSFSRFVSNSTYKTGLSLSERQSFWYLPSTELESLLVVRGLTVQTDNIHQRHHLPIPHYILVARKP